MAFDTFSLVTVSTNANVVEAATHYVVKTTGGVYYLVYIDPNSDVVFRKSSNGVTWGEPVTVFTGTAISLSIWYDRWSNISAGLIHCAYIETGGHDVLYRSIDTESSDALGTQTTIFAGASATSGGALSITRARGGNIGCIFNIDTGTEDGFRRSTDAGATWDATSADPTEGAADQWILLPGWAADSQDLMLFFWDTSADEISRKLYDDSANSWAETSIAASMVELAPSTARSNFSASVDIANSRNLLAAWTQADLANADLRFWTVTESAITEQTNVVLNSSDDQGLCAIGIDTTADDYYVFYLGLSDGSQTFKSAIQAYYKVSTDNGSTWGSETRLSPSGSTLNVLGMWCAPRFDDDGMVCLQNGNNFLLTAAAAPGGGAAGGAHILGGTVVN